MIVPVVKTRRYRGFIIDVVKEKRGFNYFYYLIGTEPTSLRLKICYETVEGAMRSAETDIDFEIWKNTR